MVLFGFFALVFVAVFWVNRAVILFDRLIADGHSAGIVMEFTALSLPKVVATVLPLAAFAGTVYVTNRLSNDSELTVVQATGFSPWRLARPVAIFGVVVALMMTVLTHVLLPASLAQLKEREVEIAKSLSARLLREGVFLHPTRGVTFYIRNITEAGELENVFLSDQRSEARSTIYTARKAIFLRDSAGPKLVMVDGMAQTLNRDGRLSTTNFSELAYDISGLVTGPETVRKRIEHLPTWDLLTRTAEVAEETRERPGDVLEEAHARFAQPLLCLAAALIGFAALLTGDFSRMGIGRQIVLAIFLLVLLKMIESAVTEPARADARLWPLLYLPGLTGVGLAGAMLAYAGRNRRRPARAARTAAAGPAGGTP